MMLVLGAMMACAHAFTPHSEPAARIRVRLAEGSALAKIRGLDLTIRSGKGALRSLASISTHASEWELRCETGRVRVLPLTGGSAPLELQEPVTLESPAGFVKLAGKLYRDQLVVHSAGSFCEVVNVIDLEQYLGGLVNSEFSSKWNEESIAAQVVAARTYALHQIRRASLDPASRFDVESTVRDQVYEGPSKEDARASRSVQRTRGLVLAAERSEPLKAFYHSTCGGTTELPEQVWGSKVPGFRRSVRCPYCASSPAISWKLKLKPAELTKAFLKGARGDGAPKSWPNDWERVLRDGRLQRVSAGALDAQRRVGTVATWWHHGRQGVQLVVPAAQFRNWLGAGRLRSTAFKVASSGASEWQLEGRGNGHGVGMCQWGAKVMGERGFKMAGILKHYYPDAKLLRVW